MGRAKKVQIPSYEEAQAIAIEHLGKSRECKKNGLTLDRNGWALLVNSEIGAKLRLPEHPDRVYQDQWEGWKKFLKKGNAYSDSYLPYKKAKKLARTLGITSFKSYWAAATAHKLPEGLPTSPSVFYKDEWESWPEFLGTDAEFNTKGSFVSYEQARDWAHGLNLSTSQEFRDWVKDNEVPEGIPKSPNVVYGQEFRDKGGWRSFLGTEFLSFEEAKAFIRKKKFESWDEFREWAKTDDRPRNFPSQPHSFVGYRNFWVSYPDFLGYNIGESASKKNVDEAMQVIKSLLRDYPQLRDKVSLIK